MTDKRLPLIPYPTSVQYHNGVFAFDNSTSISTNAAAASASAQLGSLLGLDVISAETATNTIHLHANEANSTDESYTLRVTPEQINISAAGPAGVFYGIQTLRQLLPPSVERGKGKGESWEVPCVTIEDAPRFGWRGLHLDVGRHFYPVDFIKKYIDLMALHKLNVFHWHLTEDQGWRIEIKQYPELTKTSAWRAATPFPANRKELDGKPYGGFYTQDEVREVVAYAKERFITVVPEIEMPGHTIAVLAAYPELGCVGHGYKVREFWGIEDDVFCAGNEDVYTFLENVLNEVMELFPSEFIHIGGDECPKVRWQNCKSCQTLMRQEDLPNEEALQSYFIQRMEKFINANGRRLVGWDEILEGGLAPNATVMSWRGTDGGIQAAKAGHDVVMSPHVTRLF